MTHRIEELRQTGTERYAVTLAGGETLSVPFSVAADHSLYAGRELTEEELALVRAEAALARTKERALRILGARPLSEGELYDRLVSKGESERNAAAAVAWLVELRFLNDTEYASMLVRHCAGKGYGPRRIREELYRRKVPREKWDEALEELPEQDRTVDRLLRARLKSAEPDRTELKKATDALLRRGFSWEEVRAAVERYRVDMESYD
ncbi:MAG: regulatory protein RecX [Oscillospiraceae bacterium]|nr:regulatory protein RecX [Oscillospiraceae bacterium]